MKSIKITKLRDNLDNYCLPKNQTSTIGGYIPSYFSFNYFDKEFSFGTVSVGIKEKFLCAFLEEKSDSSEIKEQKVVGKNKCKNKQ